MDADERERLERRLDRQTEQDEKKHDRRNVVVVAVLTVILSTVGAMIGSSWGARTAFEIQQGELRAERQARTRELCLELNAELDKTSQARFSDDAVSSARKDPRNEHAARWVALSHRAEVVAPVAIYDATENVSAIVSQTLVTVNIIIEGAHQRVWDEWLDSRAKSLALNLTAAFDKAADDLRRTCRAEQGEDPLPPSDTRHQGEVLEPSITLITDGLG
jgi:hypothetical protein